MLYILIKKKQTKKQNKSIGVCRTDLPDDGGQFVYRLVLHGRHNSIAVDRMGHQRLANAEFGYGSPDGLGRRRLLDRSRERQVYQ